MSIASDQASYYRHLSDPQIVTVRTDRANTGTTTDQITWIDGTTTRGGASRMDLARTRTAFGGTIQLSGDEQTWNIPNDLLVNADEIRSGDLIIEALASRIHDNSPTWQVSRVTRDSFQNQWICVCVKGRLR